MRGKHVVGVGLVLVLAGAGISTARAGEDAAGGTAATITHATPLRDGTGLYPRAIRLEHSPTGNGTIVAGVVTFATGDGVGAIYQSTDGGASFTQVGTIADPDASTNQGLCCASLYELPRPVGALPAGTLLWAGSVRGNAGPDRRMEIRVWASGDHGRTWSYLSTAAVAVNNLGLWEPEFTLSADGRLALFFSDETQQPYHSQALMETVSQDGLGWSARRAVVAAADPTVRPGMAVVRRLPSGNYFMTYEVCGGGNGCAARWRNSSDGITWGDPTNLGTRIQTVDGKYFAHAPTAAWYGNGTTSGRLVVVGQMLYNADGSVAADNGNTVLVNTQSGNAFWYELPAPVAVPTAYNNYCPNYSSTLLPSADGTQLLEIATDYASGTTVCRPSFATGSLTGSGGPADVTSTGTYRLRSVMSGDCLDVSADSRVSGGNIQQWTCNDLAPQDFRLDARTDGAFRLTGANSRLCVGVAGASTAPGANVAQYPCTSAVSQGWRLVGVGRGYVTLVNVGSGLCLDVAGGSKLAGANVQQWTCNKLSPQIWRLEAR